MSTAAVNASCLVFLQAAFDNDLLPVMLNIALFMIHVHPIRHDRL